MVERLRLGHVPEPVPAVAETFAQIDVLAVHHEPLIESAHRLENLTPDEDARRAGPRHIVRAPVPAAREPEQCAVQDGRPIDGVPQRRAEAELAEEPPG